MRVAPHRLQQPPPAETPRRSDQLAAEDARNARDSAGSVPLSPAGQLLARAQVAFRSGLADRELRAAVLRTQVAAATFVVDRESLCNTLCSESAAGEGD